MMAAPFRLARVLRLRTRLREQAQEELREAAAALVTVRERIAAIAAAADASRAAEEAAAAKGMTAVELARFRAYEDARAAEIAALAEEAKRLGEEIERRRTALLERRRGERQLERLRERNEERHATEAAKNAAILLDDLARR
jgi:flagellar export protein FliJ